MSKDIPQTGDNRLSRSRWFGKLPGFNFAGFINVVDLESLFQARVNRLSRSRWFGKQPGSKTNAIMYVIAVYDVNEKRVAKMLKLCRRYLNWIQNSVFEGEISEVKLKELIFEAGNIMDPDADSLILFKSRNTRWLDKQVVGLERMPTDNFL